MLKIMEYDIQVQPAYISMGYSVEGHCRIRIRKVIKESGSTRSLPNPDQQGHYRIWLHKVITRSRFARSLSDLQGHYLIQDCKVINGSGSERSLTDLDPHYWIWVFTDLYISLQDPQGHYRILISKVITGSGSTMLDWVFTESLQVQCSELSQVIIGSRSESSLTNLDQQGH